MYLLCVLTTARMDDLPTGGPRAMRQETLVTSDAAFYFCRMLPPWKLAWPCLESADIAT